MAGIVVMRGIGIPREVHFQVVIVNLPHHVYCYKRQDEQPSGQYDMPFVSFQCSACLWKSVHFPQAKIIFSCEMRK